MKYLGTPLGSEDRAPFRSIFNKVWDRTSVNNTIRQVVGPSLLIPFGVSDLAEEMSVWSHFKFMTTKTKWVLNAARNSTFFSLTH